MPRIVLTEQERNALNWFLQHFQLRKGKVHVQHRNGLKSLFEKVAEGEREAEDGETTDNP